MSSRPQDIHALPQRFAAARASREAVVLEGFHALKHALRFRAQVEVAVAGDREQALGLARELAPDLLDELAVLLDEVPADVLAQLGRTVPHTRVLAIARRPEYALGDVLRPGREVPAVLLEDPRQLGNLGAAIRVAAAAEAAGVLCTGARDPWDPAAVRGSAGLHFALPVVWLPSLPALDAPLIAVDPDGPPLRAGTLPADAVLAFGTERDGLSEELRRRADGAVGLPMRPGVSSLNLATSVAALLYAWRAARP